MSCDFGASLQCFGVNWWDVGFLYGAKYGLALWAFREFWLWSFYVGTRFTLFHSCSILINADCIACCQKSMYEDYR